MPQLLILCNSYIQAGADMNSTDPDTPLVVATTHGLSDCIKYLLEAGANANIPKNCVSISLLYSFYLLSVLGACNFVNHAMPSDIFLPINIPLLKNPCL